MADDQEATAAELERLRAERDELAHEVEVLQHHRQGRVRGIFVTIIAILTCITFTASVVGIWANRSALNNDVFEKRVAPLGEDPRVQAALTTFITNQVMVTIDPEKVIRDALPDQAQLLAVPLASAVETFVHDQVEKFLATDTFATLWAETTTQAHATAVKIVKGDSDVVGADDGDLVINLIPVINGVLAQIGDLSPDLFGNSVDIPTLTVDDVPDEAKKKIEDALGIELPKQFGVIRVDGAGGALAASQDAVSTFNYALYGLVAFTLLGIALSLWLSGRRRRTLLQLVVGMALGTVLVRRVNWTVEDNVLELVKVDVNRGAADAVLSQFLDPLSNATTIVLWVLVAIAVVALVTGPYAWAVRLRHLLSQAWRSTTDVAGSVSDRAQSEETIAWLRQNFSALQIGGAVVGFFLLLFADLSWLGLLLLALLVAAYEIGLWWVAGRVEDDTEELAAADEGGTPPPSDTAGTPPATL
jgi:hypothetical protein